MNRWLPPYTNQMDAASNNRQMHDLTTELDCQSGELIKYMKSNAKYQNNYCLDLSQLCN